MLNLIFIEFSLFCELIFWGKRKCFQLLLFRTNIISPVKTIIIASQSITLKLENKATIRRSAKIAQPPSINIQGSFSL